jgi:hypothetical protein
MQKTSSRVNRRRTVRASGSGCGGVSPPLRAGRKDEPKIGARRSLRLTRRRPIVGTIYVQAGRVDSPTATDGPMHRL